jgi:HD-GYP domain-containing protein (c-di-GMP phosphodiesterase class II)
MHLCGFGVSRSRIHTLTRIVLIAVCSLIAFGRQMGLASGQIRDLGIGALMFDVGKMKLPPELLMKPEALTVNEFKEVKLHVQYSLEIMEETRGITPNAVAIAATHHERFDGTGYPNGLRGGEIPLLGRMAGIVDFFDAVTSDRPHCAATSPHDAIKYLYEYRNTGFQDELIEQFIQTLGVYPVGTMVELNNGEVGIVIGQNPVQRLRPKVILVLDAEKNPLGITPIRDLMVESQDSGGRELHIKKSLEPGTYDIHPDEFYL